MFGARPVIVMAALSAALTAAPSESAAEWKKVKTYLRPGVSVVSETPQRLEVYHASTKSRVIMTVGFSREATIYRKLVRRRGGNPYWVWVAGDSFRTISGEDWSKILRVQFLRIVRRPRPQKGS